MIPLFKVFMHAAAKEHVAAVLDSGYIGQGSAVEAFENELKTLLGAPVLTVNSCTSALDLALHLIGIGPGDQVITTAQTCTATNGVIVRRGAIPVWADIDPVTGLIDPRSVEAVIGAIAPEAKAIMAVDWGGAPCDYDTLKSFGIPVIEDAAHALLARYKDQPIAESGGDYVCWSFQAIKHLTTGDGGALKTPPDQMERARLLRWYGLDRRSKASFRCEQNIEEVGYKYHMNDIAAAIGLANVDSMPEIVGTHQQHAAFYEARFSGLDPAFVSRPPRCFRGYDHESAWWLYTLCVNDRAAFSQWMADRGIETSPVHARNDRHTAFASVAQGIGPLPGLDHFAAHEIAIPVGWWLSPEDLERIVVAVIGYAAAQEKL